MDAFWLAVTNLGRDEVFIVALTLYTLLVNPQGGRNLGVAFAASYLVNSALKYGLNLPRPFTSQPELASEAAKATAGGPGLPSGHAQMGATLWWGMAAQLRRPWFWVLALALVALIAASRLILHVHYLADVVTGLLLGLAFALAAAQPKYPDSPLGRWLPLGALLLALFIPMSAPREYSVGLGLLAGFWTSRPTFGPPTTWAGRLIVGVVGLLVVFAVYFLLGALPHSIKDISVVRALRYALLILVVMHAVPSLLRPWLPPMPILLQTPVTRIRRH